MVDKTSPLQIFCRLLMCFGILSWSLPTFAQGAPPANTSVRQAPVGNPVTLSVVAGNGVERVGPGVGRCDLGTVDPFQTPRIERLFVLKNETEKPITIARLHGSCGCETLLLTKQGKEAAQVMLGPGEGAEVRIAIRVAGQHGGRLRKYAWAYCADSTEPIASLEVDFALREYVAFSPAFLNFGPIARGETRSLSLTVMIDATLLPSHSLPNLTSSNPDIEIRPEGPLQQIELEGKPRLAQSYRVTLTNRSRQGLLTGTLHFTSPTPLAVSQPGAGGGTASSGPVTKEAHVPAAITLPGNLANSLSPLFTVSVGVSGELLGGIAATPKSLFFGSIISGKQVMRQIILSGMSVDTLKGITVSSSSPWLTVRLQDSQDTPGSKFARRVIEAILSEHAPPGVLTAQITVAAADGERLVLPVVGEITRIPAR